MERDKWSDEEQALFYQAVKLFGGESDVKTRFTKISEMVKTKKPKECALFARQRFMQQQGPSQTGEAEG